MLMKQRNKGFTLVELLVSMCILAIVMTELMALMFNSSKLYRNGAFEVELQSEAQQIIQQFEELVIDANSSVSYNVTDITITNKAPGSNYKFTLSMNAGKSYGDLYLSVNGGTEQVMGEYVKSVSLDMANYDDASRIRLVLEMENDMYTYSAAKDIYLRNNIGTNDIQISSTVSNACEYALNVLRFHTYKLEDIYGSQYVYVFDQDTHTEYDFTGPTKAQVAAGTWVGGSYQIKTSSTFNAASNDDKGPEYEVQALEPIPGGGGYTEAFKIKVYSEPVMFGFDGAGLITIPNTSTPFYNYYSVQGVSLDPGDITSIKYELCGLIKVNSANVTSNNVTVGIGLGDSYTDNVNQFTFINRNFVDKDFVIKDLGTVTGKTNLSAVMDKSPSGDVCLKVTGTTSDINTNQIKLFSTKYDIDVNNNDFICINEVNYPAGNPVVFESFIKDYGVPYIKVTFSYPNSRTFVLKLYPYPVGKGELYLPPTYTAQEHNLSYEGEVQERFFDMIGM